MPRLLTLGRFELRSDGSAPADRAVISTQPKRLALLAYLSVATPIGFHRRDTLLGLFWPELGTDEARRALRQALYYLRQALGSEAITTRSDDQVGLIDGGIWCDAAELERAVEGRRDADAVALYQGDFLAGVFMPDVSPDLEQWVDRTRSRLRLRAIDAAWRLADLEQAAGNEAAAAAAATRAHEFAPDDESGLRRLLELLKRQARRAEALEAYAAFARRLAQDGDDPDAQTVELIDQIRSGPATARVLEPLELDHSQSLSSPATIATLSGANRRPPWVWPAAAMAAIAVGISLVLALRSSSRSATLMEQGTLAQRDRVLVADFRNRTRDSTLGGTIAEALRADLGQSPVVRVMTTAQVHGALRGMERPVEVSLDDSLTRAVALREGVKAFVTGDVSAVGTTYVLSVRIVAALTGDQLVAVRETATDSTDLIPAIDRLSGQLRRQIGETLRAVQAAPPLQQVTTGSLEALRKYTQAMYVNEVVGDRATAIGLLLAAVAVDTGFATAYRMLGSIYASNAEPGRAEAALVSAFAHRDRLPLRDRYLTMGSYYRNVTAEYPKAAAAYRALLELYPTDLSGLNNLGLVLAHSRQYAQAESLFHRVVAIDSEIPSVYLGLAESRAMQGHFDAARQTLDEVWRRFPNHPNTELSETYVAAARQDWSTAERHIRRRLAQSKGKPSSEADALLTLGQIELVVGRLGDAERDIRASMTLSAKEQSPGRHYAGAIVLGWLELRYRARTTQALERVDAAMARFPLDSIAAADRPYGELAEFFTAAGQGARASAMLVAVERNAPVGRIQEVKRHSLRGAAALAEGRGRDAVVEYTQADAAARCSVCALPALARAHEQAGDVDAATAIYERYVNTPWIWRFETDAPHLGWSMRRLGELYERRQQPAKAAEQYARLLQLWSNADGELTPALTELRARYERLHAANAPR